MHEGTVIEVAGIMFLATIFRTVFGFGEALVSVPLLALIISVKVAAPVAVLASIVIAGFIVLRDWRHIHLREAGRLIFWTLFGLPVGLFLLKAVPESVMKSVLACIILAFSGYAVSHPRKISLQSDRFVWVFGFIAGITGGSYGMNGPPLAIYGALRGWSPEKFRATLQGYFLPASLFGICGYAATGLWTTSVSLLFLWSLPAILAGIFIGRSLNRWMDARRFGYLLHFGLIFVACLLLFQGFR
jgi:uncharacterized membrane protein YfcA